MCKALVAQGIESCCITKRKLSPERIRNAPSSRNRGQTCRTETIRVSRSTKRLCAEEQKIEQQVQTSLDRSMLISNFDEPPSEDAKDPAKTGNDSSGLERGTGAMEHVVLSVQGITCTGCETKLHRSIMAIQSAKNGQASIVLSRAEFDIDTTVTTADQAVAQLERATGFVLSKLSTAGHVLRIRETVESKRLLEMDRPLGVLDIKRSDGEAIIIAYDADKVQARELLERVFGLHLELAPIRPPATIAAGSKHVREVGYKAFFSATMTVPVLVFAWAPLPPNEVVYQSVSLALATVVQVVVAGPFYSSALRSLVFSRVVEMDLLIVLSTSAAFVFSIIAYICMMTGRPLSTGEFFESSTLLVTLIMIGRFISSFARQQSVESISISSLQPTEAVLVNEHGQAGEEIDSRTLHYGDVFLVMPDTRIVTDGTVVSGNSEVDESMITGESKLVAKERGSSVVAGSVNGRGLMHVKVARLPSDNTISSITAMVDRAKMSKPKIQELADQVAGYFVPVVVAITIVIFCVWIAIGDAIRHQSTSDAVVNALTYAIAVLIVSCPCAVGLAVPMVVVVACGIGAEHGVIFKSAQSIESCWRATHVVFDKTGTLTQGNANVVHEELLPTREADCLSLLLGLVSGNRHPISSALTRHLAQQSVEASSLDSVETIVGKGVQARKGSTLLRAGSATWLGLEDSGLVQSLHANGLTTFCFDIDGVPQTVFGLSDTLRPQAKQVVANLISRGIDVSIVSGDSVGAVHSIGRELGLDEAKLRAKYTPQEKQQYVQDLTRDKKRVVIFCGDGSNDAGALAQATIGIHMSEGTDVARSASDAVLMRSDISALLTLMEISRAAFRRIILNFCWAGVYNLFAILLAAGAFVNFRIPPQYAGLGEVVSVLPVIVIALLLKWIQV